MSRIRERISSAAQQVAAGVNSVENSILVTTNKLLIEDNKITLPSPGYGNVMFNMALIFNDNINNHLIAEVTCSMGQDGLSVIFDEEDNMNGNYAVVSYLGRGSDE